jgi:hypothetical protein
MVEKTVFNLKNGNANAKKLIIAAIFLYFRLAIL